MSGAFPAKVVAAGEGKTVMLFGVRFGVPPGSRSTSRSWRRSWPRTGRRRRADLRRQTLSSERLRPGWVAGQAVLQQR
ncbi:MAG TPA: hypothetical protein VGD83_03560, partial [Streptosporangiaceae bacterium]